MTSSGREAGTTVLVLYSLKTSTAGPVFQYSKYPVREAALSNCQLLTGPHQQAGVEKNGGIDTRTHLTPV